MQVQRTETHRLKRKRFLFVSHASADNPRLLPVIAALLESGLPLWFDKPGDIGRKVHEFTGHIPLGETWHESLIAEMSNAHAMLFFPSEAYKKSNECLFELAQGSVHKTNSNNRFKIIPLILEEAWFKFLDARGTNLQGKKALVRQRNGVWELDPRGETDLHNLIIELKAILASGPAPLSAVSGPRTERRSDYAVPYRVDRTLQRELVRDAYSQVVEASSAGLRAARGSVRRPAVICHGSEFDEHKRFTSTTLPDVLLRRAPQFFKPGSTTYTPLRPRWPHSGTETSLEDFKRVFRDNMIEKFQGAELRRASESLHQLATAFNRDDTTRIVASRLDVDPEKNTDSRSLLRQIEAWLAFWDAFPFDQADCEAHFLVVPVLEVVYSARKPRGFFRKRNASDDLRKRLSAPNIANQFNSVLQQVEAQILPHFDQISAKTVREWVEDDNELFGTFSLDAQDDIETDLKSVFADTPALDMRDWSQKATPILERYGVGLKPNI